MWISSSLCSFDTSLGINSGKNHRGLQQQESDAMPILLKCVKVPEFPHIGTVYRS